MHEVFTFSWSEDTAERDPWFLFFFSVTFCCFFLMQWGGVWHCFEVSVTVTPPHPFNLKTPHPTTLPTLTTLFFLLLLVKEITLYFHCRSPGEPRWEPSSPRLWHSSPPSHLWCYHPSQSYRYRNEYRRENQKEAKKRGDSVNSDSLVFLSQLKCLLWAAFCVIFQKKEGKNEGKTCKMLWGNLFSLLELNAFHT